MLGLWLLTLPPETFLALLIGYVVKKQIPAIKLGIDSPL